MSEHVIHRPMGPLQEGDQAIVDALQQLPTGEEVLVAPPEAVVTSLVANRETTPGEPKDHWSVTSLKTDQEGNPQQAITTLVTSSAKDINVILRDGNEDIRTEENKPKALDRLKLHDRQTEQSIKLLAANRIHKAAKTIVKINTQRKS